MPRGFDEERGRAAALKKWAYADPEAGTRQARAGFLARFEKEVDPDGVLSDEERETRARRLLRAHMINLARQSRKARAERRLAK